MFQHSLEEAGRRLLEQRRALKNAEVEFRSQYEEAKRSIEAQLKQVRSRIEENERKARTDLANMGQANLSSTLEEREKVQREIDGTFETLRTELAKNDALFQSYLKEAARIIGDT